MGILDSKTRFLDSFITQEGRRQIASGKLKAEFYSFSDAAAIYSYDDMFASGSGVRADISTRICFEATNSPNDQVSFESDDAGSLVVKEFKNINNQNIRVVNGQFLSGNIGSDFNVISSSATFGGIAASLLSSSVDHFKNLNIIGSPDPFNKNKDEFIIDQNKIDFLITDVAPIASQTNGGTREASIDHIESLFADKRLSHVPNFLFLPPVNKPRLGTNETRILGIYVPIGQKPIFEYEELQSELREIDNSGYAREISFRETSEQSRIFAQLFEVGNNQIKKLDIIDFGIFTISGAEMTESAILEAERRNRPVATKHVFFAGKVFIDSNGSHVFVNMFTIIFSN